MDVLQGHVELAEATDDLRHRDLIGAVPAIPGVVVDVGGVEHADAVVVAQRLDAQVGGAREVADRQERTHAAQYRASP